MRRSTVLILAVIGAMLSFPFSSDTQWVQTGPFGDSVYSFALGGDSIIAGTSGGVFFSYFPYIGEKWTRSNCGLFDVAVYAVAVTGRSVFGGSRVECISTGSLLECKLRPGS